MNNEMNKKTFGEYTIELKGVKEIYGHDDCLPFEATLYINNKKIAQCGNDGWGGLATVGHIDDKNRALFEAAKEAIAEAEKGKTYQHSIYDIIDEIACLVVDEQNFQKFLKKNQKNHLVFYSEEHGNYMGVPFMCGRKKVDLLTVLDTDKDLVKATIEKYAAKGYVCRNTNFNASEL